MRLGHGRKLTLLLSLLLLTTICASCSSARPEPSASGLCRTTVAQVIELTPDEHEQTPLTVQRKIANLNAAVLGACGALH